MLKHTLATLLVICFTLPGFTQYVLKTPDGKTVRLNTDGTWRYENNTGKKDATVKIPNGSTAQYTSMFKKFAVWYDPAQWSYDTTKPDKSNWWSAVFTSSDNAITAYYWESRLTMATDNFQTYITNQYEGVGKVLSFTSARDTINNIPVIIFDMDLEANGIAYRYRGYVYSSTRGSIQFIAGTQKEVFEEDIKKIYALLNGLVRL
jgi:hypothetical protein